MPDTPQSLSNRLREEGDRVVEFFNGLSAGQWPLLVYPKESDWDYHNLLAHFVSAEIGRKELIINILAGGRGVSDKFDINLFNHREVERFSGKTNDTLLELFRRERSDLAALVSGLIVNDLELIGKDPYLGEAALAEMIKLTYRHLQIHLREIRRSM